MCLPPNIILFFIAAAELRPELLERYVNGKPIRISVSIIKPHVCQQNLHSLG